MTIFVDASALVSIVTGESDASTLVDVLAHHVVRLTSGPAMWESVRAVARAGDGSIEQAWQLCERYRVAMGIALVPFGADEATEAVRAHARYGKGHHPARLNMGDCFAYACAKTNNAQLLYKGDDFARTDLA